MATIQPTDIKVKFLHFTGTKTLWESFIKNSELESGYIVYGYIYDVEDKSTRKLVSKQIYAGKDTNNLQYIYEVGGGSSSSIVVDTYEKAEEQLSSLSEGDIISTRNDQTVYIVLKSPETEELELVKICKRCKWLYAADTSISGDNWHVASDVITNPMGMIAENTTLGKFVELTEGEFSRMIEMMLFTNPKPTISIASLPETQTPDPYTLIAINVATTNATDTSIYVYNGSELVKTIENVKDGDLLIEGLTSGTSYLILGKAKNTYYTEPATASIERATQAHAKAKVTKLASSNIKHNSVVLTVDSSNASTATLYNETTGDPIGVDFVNREASTTVEGLNAGKTYKFVANASNIYYSEKDSSSLTISTIAFVEPSVSLNATSAKSAKSNSLNVSTASIKVNNPDESEYVVAGRNTYTLKDGNTTIVEDANLNTIKAIDISYGKTYTLYTKYDASLNTTYVKGDVSVYTKEVNTTIYQKVPDNASVKITKVNGVDVDYTKPVEILTDSMTVTINSSARIYSGIVKVYVQNGDGTKIDISTYSITETNTSNVEISGLTPSTKSQYVIVELSDEYGTKSTLIEFSYTKEEVYYISYISSSKSYVNAEAGEITATDLGAPEYPEEGPQYIFENTTNKSWDFEGSFKPGFAYGFIIDNAVEGLVNVKELTSVTVENIVYYKYVPNIGDGRASRYVLVPVGKSVTFYEGTDGNTKPSTTEIESYSIKNNYEYNGQTFDIYYCSPGNTWENVDVNGCCFIKIN